MARLAAGPPAAAQFQEEVANLIAHRTLYIDSYLLHSSLRDTLATATRAASQLQHVAAGCEGRVRKQALETSAELQKLLRHYEQAGLAGILQRGAKLPRLAPLPDDSFLQELQTILEPVEAMQEQEQAQAREQEQAAGAAAAAAAASAAVPRLPPIRVSRSSSGGSAWGGSAWSGSAWSGSAWGSSAWGSGGWGSGASSPGAQQRPATPSLRHTSSAIGRRASQRQQAAPLQEEEWEEVECIAEVRLQRSPSSPVIKAVGGFMSRVFGRSPSNKVMDAGMDAGASSAAAVDSCPGSQAGGTTRALGGRGQSLGERAFLRSTSSVHRF
jgi:hypothetical protein